MKKLFIILSVLIFCYPINGWSEARQSPDKLFKLGIETFQKDDYAKATSLLKNAIQTGLIEPQLSDAKRKLKLLSLISKNADVISVGKYKKQAQTVWKDYKVNFCKANGGVSNAEDKQRMVNNQIEMKLLLVVADANQIKVTEEDIKSAMKNDTRANKYYFDVDVDMYKEELMFELLLQKLQLAHVITDATLGNIIKEYKEKTTITVDAEFIAALSCI